MDTLEVGGSPQIGGRGAEKRESGFGRDVEIPVDLAGVLHNVCEAGAFHGTHAILRSGEEIVVGDTYDRKILC